MPERLGLFHCYDRSAKVHERRAARERSREWNLFVSAMGDATTVDIHIGLLGRLGHQKWTSECNKHKEVIYNCW